MRAATTRCAHLPNMAHAHPNMAHPSLIWLRRGAPCPAPPCPAPPCRPTTAPPCVRVYTCVNYYVHV
eukprot:387044-Prymnesium_polylepis.1